jgi:hypothetical protein
MQQTASDKAIQRMNATRNPSQQQTEVVNQIVGRLQPTVSVTKEQRLAEPVVKPTKPDATTAVDQLTKAFEKLSVNLLQQVQSQQQQQSYQQTSRPYGQYPPYGPGQQSYGRPEAPKGPQNMLGKSVPSVNVGVYAAEESLQV